MFQYKLLSVSESGNNGKFHLPCSVHFLIIGSSYVDGQDKLLLFTDQKCKHLVLPTTADFRIDSEYYLKKAEIAMCDKEHYCPLVSKPQKLSYNSILLFFLKKNQQFPPQAISEKKKKEKKQKGRQKENKQKLKRFSDK